MFFPSPLISARLVRRYKRFLADVILEDGQQITVSVPNTGSMLGLITPGERVWLSSSNDKTRKYRYKLEIVEADNTLVGVNTTLPNKLGEEAITLGLLPELGHYQTLKREQRYGEKSRIDLLLSGKNIPDIYIEIKNVHYIRTPQLAEFPDTVTARGARHLQELTSMVQKGARGVMLFIIQRDDCEAFSICSDLDPEYGCRFVQALNAGVEAYAVKCHVNAESIRPYARIEIGKKNGFLY